MSHHDQTILCTDAVRHFSNQFDTELRLSIRRHLHQCPNCAAYLDSLKKVVRLYRAYLVPPLNVQMRTRLERSILFSHVHGKQL